MSIMCMYYPSGNSQGLCMVNKYNCLQYHITVSPTLIRELELENSCHWRPFWKMAAVGGSKMSLRQKCLYSLKREREREKPILHVTQRICNTLASTCFLDNNVLSLYFPPCALFLLYSLFCCVLIFVMILTISVPNYMTLFQNSHFL